jgi:ribonucleotide monophosphatase NagD (HAD superfamily)
MRNEERRFQASLDMKFVSEQSADTLTSKLICTCSQLTENQLVQSHTPFKKLVKPYADKHVLCIGGKGDAIRRTALS